MFSRLSPWLNLSEIYSSFRPTFRAQLEVVEVERSSKQGQFLEDDAKAVNISFLSPTGEAFRGP